MTSYLLLLRGINVGGNNLIKMVDLKLCLETLDLANVRTYIQSGNVVFDSPETDASKLTTTIETQLSKVFSYTARVVLRSHHQLQQIVAQAPKGFGQDPTIYRYDVIFLKEPLTPEEAMKSVSTREGVDQAYAGKDALYFARLIAQASHSRLPKVASTPAYQHMTIRNWNTTTKLLALMNSPS